MPRSQFARAQQHGDPWNPRGGNSLRKPGQPETPETLRRSLFPKTGTPVDPAGAGRFGKPGRLRRMKTFGTPMGKRFLTQAENLVAYTDVY